MPGVKKSHQKKARQRKASLGRNCTTILPGNEDSECNSCAVDRNVVRFACDEGPACEATTFQVGTTELSWNIHPLAELRAGPPGEALLSRCFLVTSLHQQRSNPLSAGQRKLCSGQQRSDPLGLRPSGSFGSSRQIAQAQRSRGSSALVVGEGSRLLRFGANQNPTRS